MVIYWQSKYLPKLVMLADDRTKKPSGMLLCIHRAHSLLMVSKVQEHCIKCVPCTGAKEFTT